MSTAPTIAKIHRHRQEGVTYIYYLLVVSKRFVNHKRNHIFIKLSVMPVTHCSNSTHCRKRHNGQLMIIRLTYQKLEPVLIATVRSAEHNTAFVVSIRVRYMEIIKSICEINGGSSYLWIGPASHVVHNPFQKHSGHVTRVAGIMSCLAASRFDVGVSRFLISCSSWNFSPLYPVELWPAITL